MESFSESYVEARGTFLVACAGAGARARLTTYRRQGLLGRRSHSPLRCLLGIRKQYFTLLAGQLAVHESGGFPLRSSPHGTKFFSWRALQ